MIKLIQSKTGYPLAVLKHDSHVSRWVEEAGELCHDGGVRPLLCRHIKPGDTVVDAGANIGDHTIAYSEAAGPTGLVMAFEPIPLTFVCLAFNMRDCANVVPLNFALADHQLKEADMAHGENVGAAYIVRDPANPYPTDRVLVTTLDRFELPKLAFMKIDVEGSEVNVIKGASETIRRCRPVIACEIARGHLARQGTTPEELVDLMRSLGYAYEFLDPTHNLQMDQTDVLFRPQP